MATKTKTFDPASGQITDGMAPASASLTPGRTLSREQFAALQGEKAHGINIIKLEVGSGAGPFILVEILKDQDLSPSTGGKKKKMEPVDVYVATDSDGLQVRMPVAASFVAKAKEHDLAAGDEFSIFRDADYKSKAWGTRGQSYLLTITKRKGKK